MDRLLFFLGIFLFIVFEIMNVYFIMPMPGSQDMNSIDVAYFLYRWRWMFRILFSIIILYGFGKASWTHRWIPFIFIVFLAVVIYLLNFRMAADHMFYQPSKLSMVSADDNKVDVNRLIIGVERDGVAKAYPIQFLGFHHQVKDTLNGMPIIVTYCTVCRTGRVFNPVVSGKYEKFRLVGMDHFNAMFEDVSTKSWWRQATGEAIAGKLKGEKLPELLSTQTSLNEWLKLYPNSFVMQADPSFSDSYDSTFKFENGTSKKKLTGTDSLSWKNKSWVLGVKSGNDSKAYDWNQLKKERIIHDKIHESNIILVLSADNKSFFAYEVPAGDLISLKNDTLFNNQNLYRLDGRGINTTAQLKRLPVYQEFWHSWRTFHPNTEQYQR
jgi:hypothetical protein